MTATIAMIKNINQIGIVYMFNESEIFLHNIDGSNTLLLTDQQEYQILGIFVMIESHDILKIMDFILFPVQIIVFFTDCSFFYRL